MSASMDRLGLKVVKANTLKDLQYRQLKLTLVLEYKEIVDILKNKKGDYKTEMIIKLEMQMISQDKDLDNDLGFIKKRLVNATKKCLRWGKKLKRDQIMNK